MDEAGRWSWGSQMWYNCVHIVSEPASTVTGAAAAAAAAANHRELACIKHTQVLYEWPPTNWTSGNSTYLHWWHGNALDDGEGGGAVIQRRVMQAHPDKQHQHLRWHERSSTCIYVVSIVPISKIWWISKTNISKHHFNVRYYWTPIPAGIPGSTSNTKLSQSPKTTRG